MQIRLSFWCYPGVLLFSVLMHGLLVFYLMKVTKLNSIPTMIQWFDLTEQIPSAFSKPSPLSKNSKPSIQRENMKSPNHQPSKDQMLKSRFTTYEAVFTEKPEASSERDVIDKINNISSIHFSGNQESDLIDLSQGLKKHPAKTGKGMQLHELVTSLPKDTVNLEEVLIKTRGFSNQTPWNDQKNEKPISSNLGSLLKQIKMAKVNTQNPANMKLDSKESKIYRNKLDNFFAQNWVVPLHLAESELTVVVRFKIDKQGKILASKIENSSGRKELDHSVQNLLKNLKSLPSLPYSYPGHTYDFGIKFTPRDLQF